LWAVGAAVYPPVSRFRRLVITVLHGLVLVHTAWMESAAIDDDIVAARIIPAINGIRAELSCGIPAALDEFQQRYERLRAQRPDDFALPPEEYGRGFYS
jgi:hypothetical protein